VIANSDTADGLKTNALLTYDQIETIIGTNTSSSGVMTIDGITTNWSYDDAKMLCELNLQSVNTSLKGDVFVLAPNDNNARGIISALEADAGITSFKITGQDAEKESVQSIIDGQQSMTVFKDVRTLARDATTAAIEILKGHSPSTSGSFNNGVKEVLSVVSDIASITVDNIQETLIDTGYYSSSDFTGL
jgi:putative multiple sugar transport system substrate-binding protein